MNYRHNLKIIGRVLRVEAVLLLLPAIIALIYQESFKYIISYLVASVMLGVLSVVLNKIKDPNKTLHARDGFFVVAVSWLLMALIGALPFVINGDIPNYIDAFFEITSGFTTTGATIVANIDDLAHSSLFWRSFSHWIGGMGILVFILAIMPKDDSGSGASVYVLRAESPGPSVGKLTSKMRVTTRILYSIYIAITALLIILLVCDRELNLFQSIILAFGTTGTGGFALLGTSIATYSNYVQYCIAIFMFLSGVNFSLYYLLLLRKWKQFFKSEELRTYVIIVLASIIIIVASISRMYTSFNEAFRHGLFQTLSIISTTGYATVDTNSWPTLAKTVLVFLMFIGGMAGSTAGGLKISRAMMLFKTLINKLRLSINPRRIYHVKQEEQLISDSISDQVTIFFFAYVVIIFVCALLISIDGHDLLTNFSASLACISNVGPGFGLVGSMNDYTCFSAFSKIILSIEMIVGRLELVPILILFSPKTWSKA